MTDTPVGTRPRTIIDVLAALPESELSRLREKNRADLERARAEVARLEVQEQQFAMAAASLGAADDE